MSKVYNYNIVLSREVTAINKEDRKMGDLSLNFQIGDDPLAINKDGLTGFGYKVLVSSLVAAITELSKDIKKIGGSEGEVIGDAISQLQRNLVDGSRSAPVSSVDKV